MKKAINGADYCCKNFANERVESEQAVALQDKIDAVLSTDVSIDEALSPEILSLAAWASLNDMARYVKLKKHISKVVGARTFAAEVKKQLNSEKKETPLKFLRLSGIETRGVLVPEDWLVDDDGIRHLENVRGEWKDVLVSREPVFVSSKFVDVDDGLVDLEVTFRDGREYKALKAPIANLVNRSTIVNYSNFGFPVYSQNAGAMSSYVAEMMLSNKESVPVCKSIRRAGWIGDEFYPYAIADCIVPRGDGSDTENILSALKESGSEDAWIATAEKVRTMPFARTIMAASFASPLLEKLHHRNIFIHSWFGSRSGKTAALKFAMSVWGDPSVVLGSYNTTLVGLERKAGTLRNLPLALDEFQTLNQKRLSVSDIVYNLGNGVGKTRGQIKEGIQRMESWRNCILSTGEQPMSSDNSMDGVHTRLLEIYACPLSKDGTGTVDDAIAKELHQVAELNYGFAGGKFIRWIIDHLDRLSADHSKILKALECNSSKLDSIAVLALADFYSSIAVFEQPEDQALSEAVSLGKLLLKNQEENAPKDSIEAAWDFVCSWVAVNRAHFLVSSRGYAPEPHLGRIAGDRVWVVVSELKKALEANGYVPNKCIKGFMERGLISTFTDSDGNKRSDKPAKINGFPARIIELILPVI